MAAVMALIAVVSGLLSIVWEWVGPFFRANFIWFSILGVVVPVAAFLMAPAPDREKPASDAFLLCAFSALSVLLVSVCGVVTWVWRVMH